MRSQRKTISKQKTKARQSEMDAVRQRTHGNQLRQMLIDRGVDEADIPLAPKLRGGAKRKAASEPHPGDPGPQRTVRVEYRGCGRVAGSSIRWL